MSWQEDVGDICKKLHKEGYRVFFSGSTTRNIKLKINQNIYYIFTTADLIGLSRLFDVEFPGKTYYDAELKENNFLIRFKHFSYPKNGNIFTFLKEEAQKEVFTFDTLFFNPHKERYFDPSGNYYSLRDKKIIPADNFSINYQKRTYKIFDAICLSSNYGSTISEDFLKAAEKIEFTFQSEFAGETREGFNKAITSENPYLSINLMDRLNIITELFPELVPAKRIEQDKDHHPEGNVYEHTLECFKHIKKAPLTLAVSLLLHDAGKPETATVTKKKLRFPGHSQRGAVIARKALKRLGYKNNFIEDVIFLIRYHLLGHEFRKWDERRRKEMMSHRLFPLLLKLYRADILSCYGDLSEYRKISAFYHKVYS